MGLDKDDEEVLRAITLAVMEQEIEELEKGLDTMVGPKGVKLSGGQIQRTAAARMFVREPELLVFDDLSSALDVETERKIYDSLKQLKQNKTILIISHRPSTTIISDNVVFIEKGRIMESASMPH